jgi:hypothetical protein
MTVLFEVSVKTHRLLNGHMANLAAMKMKCLLPLLSFTASVAFAQQTQIYNSTGQSLDSLLARQNQKLVDYKDPADNADFKTQNRCTACKADTSVFTCTKTVGSVTYKLFACRNLATLQQLKTDTIPGNNDILLFYQTFESRVYDFSKEERPTRHMSVSISANIKKEIKQKKFDPLEIVRVYEHTFFDMTRFSGTALYSEIENELGGQ